MILVGKFWSDAAPQAADSSGASVGVDGSPIGAHSVADGLEAGALTETTAAESPWGGAPVEMPAWGSLLMQFGLALLVVVVLILVLQKVARRFGPHWKRGQNFDDIQVLSERSMGQKLSLAIVEVADQRWLVSISPQGIQRVADIDYEMDPPIGIAETTPAPAAAGHHTAPAPGVGGLSKDEFNQFEQQLKSRLQVTEAEYPSLSDYGVKS